MKVSTRYPLQPRRTNKSIIDETSEKEPIPEKKKKRKNGGLPHDLSLR